MLELQSQAMDEFISGSTHRIRKTAQFFRRDDVSEENAAKRRRIGNYLSEGNELIHGDSGSDSDLDKNFLEMLEKSDFDEELKNLGEAKKSLYLSLKSEISPLCKILKLEGKSEGLVIKFLEYMMNHNNVSSYASTMLQAFQISLEINREQSIALAKQHLNFDCRKYEAEFAYLMLTCFKTIFAYWTGIFEEVSLSSEKPYRYARNNVVRCVNQIQNKCRKKLRKLTQKQEEEKERIICGYKENKLKLQERIRMESMVIRACCEENSSLRQNKLRALEVSSAEESEELESKRSMSLKSLELKEQGARTVIQETKACWLDAVNTLVCLDLFGKTLQDEYLDILELLGINEDSPHDSVDHVASINAPSAEVTMDVPVKAAHSGVQEMMISGDGDQTLDTIEPSAAVDKAALNVPEKKVQLEVQEMLPSTNGVLKSADEPSSKEPDTTAIPVMVNEIQPETVSSADDCTVNIGSLSKLPTQEQLSESAITYLLDVETPSAVPEPSRGEVEANHISEENDEMGIDQLYSSNISVALNPPLQESSQMMNNVQPEITLSDGDQMAPNQDQDECTARSTAGIMQPEEASGANQQNASEAPECLVLSQPVDDISAPNQSVNGTVSEPAAQADVLPSSNPLARENHSMGVDEQDSPNIVVIQDPLQELSQINSSSMQPEMFLNNGDLVPPNQDQDECTMQPEEASGANQQTTSEALEWPASSQPVDYTSAPNQSVDDVTVSEPAAQMEMLPSTNPFCMDNNSTSRVSLSKEAPIIESCAFNQVPEPPVETAASNPPFSNPPIVLPSPGSSLVSSGLPPSVVHFSGPRVMHMVYELNNHSVLPIAASGISPPVYSDPLWEEMERLSAEFDGVRKIHEDTKLHLKSEREKEIEEAWAKINHKYDLKHQDIDANLLSKRNEFSGRFNKVMLSKMLAEAFRNFNSDASLQIANPPLQQIARPRPLLMGTSSTISPPVRQQTCPPELNPPFPSVAACNTPPPPPMFVTSTRSPPPPLQTTVAPPGAVTIAIYSPPPPAQANVGIGIPLMVARHTPPPAAARPLQVNLISYYNTRPSGGAQISTRATAPPHLWRRSPTQPVNFASPNSSALPSPPIPPRLPVPPTATLQVNPVNRALRVETTITTTGELPNIPNLTSVLDSLHGQASQVTPVRFTSRNDLETCTNRLNTAAAASGITWTRVDQGASTGEPADLVYLSDDD